jgi:hypothetical protein
MRAYDQETAKRIPNQWICIAFAFKEGEDAAYIGDFKHGMCELYTPFHTLKVDATAESDTT